MTRAARRLLVEDSSLAERAAAGTLTELRLVGPFVARFIREILDGSRPLDPPVDEWPASARGEYHSTEVGRTHFINLFDARRLIRERRYPPPSGDLQMHTTWSDGTAAPRAMARACQGLGYLFIAITDHTRGLRIARGMSTDAIARQRETLHRMASHINLRVFAGMEANVLPTGELDVSLDDLAGTEVVVASCHSALRRLEDQTDRLIAAVSHPAVHILGHPRGRIFGVPRGIRARWDEVFDAAARHGTAIEINSAYDRQDIDYALAGAAIDAGTEISLGTDSHSLHELPWMDLAVAHLIQADVPRERVLNYRSVKSLEEWLVRKQVGAGAMN